MVLGGTRAQAVVRVGVGARDGGLEAGQPSHHGERGEVQAGPRWGGRVDYYAFNLPRPETRRAGARAPSALDLAEQGT